MAIPELLANSPTPGTREAFTTLSAELKTTETSMTWAKAPPTALHGAGQFHVIIGSEIMICEAGETTTVKILARKSESSAEVAHLIGAQVWVVPTVGAFTTWIFESGLIPSTGLKSEAVTAAKIAKETITSTQLTNNTIEAGDIKAEAIVAAGLGKEAVTTEKIKLLAVTEGLLATAIQARIMPANTVAMAYCNEAQKIKGSENIKIKINTVIKDPGSNISTVSNFYTAPSEGYYSVTAQVFLKVEKEKVLSCKLFRSGGEILKGTEFITGPEGSYATNATGIIFCKAAEKIELYVFQSGAEKELIVGTIDNYLHVVRVA